jgi:DNA-binding MarR family transcriptional regulator
MAIYCVYKTSIAIPVNTAMTDAQRFPRVLRAAYLAMHRLSDAHFARSGVTADQFVLLAALAAQSKVTQQDVVHRISSDPSTVRSMLILLEGRGLVKRERHPGDRRAHSVSLTSKGRRLFDKLWLASEPIRGQLLAGFEPEEIKTLVTLLQRVKANATSSKGRPQGDRKQEHRRSELCDTPCG